MSARHAAFAIVWLFAATSALGVFLLPESDHDTGDSQTEFDEGYVAGQAEAKRDLQRNYLAVERYGRQFGNDAQEQKILLRRFGIHVRWVAGCFGTARDVGH